MIFIKLDAYCWTQNLTKITLVQITWRDLLGDKKFNLSIDKLVVYVIWYHE